MPAALLDPTVAAQGSIPASPISKMLSGVIGVANNQFLTPLERTQQQYEQAKTQQLQQQMGSGSSIQDIVNSIYSQPSGTPAAPGVSPSQTGDNAPAAPLPLNTDQQLHSRAGDIFKAAFDSGHPELAAGLLRAVTANAPGVSVLGSDAAHPSPVSMSMLGAGDAYTSTPDAAIIGVTPEQRNRNANIQRIMSTQGASYPQAEAIIDGVNEYTTDQAGNRVMINKANNNAQLLYSPGMSTAQSVLNPGNNPQNAPPAPSVNNPGNLRPVGSSVGFQQFATPQDGVNALQHDLLAKLTGKSAAMGSQPVTLRNLISTYSPPNENNTASLVQNAAQRTGLNPDATLDARHLPLIMDAILKQEGNGASNIAAQQPVSTAPPAAPVNLDIGNAGIPFDQMYGGIGEGGQSRAEHAIGSLMGGNTLDPARAAFGKLSSLKGGLIAAERMTPRGTSGATGNNEVFEEGWPETDPDQLAKEGGEGLAQARMSPVDAQSAFNSKISQAVNMRNNAAFMANVPTLDTALKNTFLLQAKKIDTTLENALPSSEYNKYAAQMGLPLKNNDVAPQTNLQQGTAATGIPAFKNIQGQPSYTPSDIAFTASKRGMTTQQVVDRLRAAGKVE